MEPKEYAPCINCEKRLQQIKNHIANPFHDTDLSYIPNLFRDVYLHCPGTHIQAFAKFASEKITAVLASYDRHCRPPIDMYKAKRILQTHGQLAELAERLLEVTTRQELTFLMFQADKIGAELSDMGSYENYERLVSGRVWELDGNADSTPDSVYFILQDYPQIVADQEENEQGLLELAAHIDEQNKTINEQRKTIDDQQAEIVRLQQSLSSKDVTLDQLRKSVAEKDAQISQLQPILLDRALQINRVEIATATIAQLHKIVAEKDAQIAKLQNTVDKVQHLIEK